MALVFFFLLGLIAGGLLCRRGPRGIEGPTGMPGQDGHDKELRSVFTVYRALTHKRIRALENKLQNL